MLNDNDKAIHLVVSLIGLTNSKKITWRREPLQLGRPPYDVRFLNPVYVAQVNMDIFRLSEFEYRRQGENRHHWKHGAALDIIDLDGRVLWRCPPNPAIEDLLRIVEEATFDVDEVMARLDLLRQAS
jgi:hypothetical protein